MVECLLYMTQSVKENYAFNLLNTISGLLFPLITFPYASRIMMADGIGHVNFYQSIISYISLLSCIGIPMYAVREIAKVRDDKELQDRTAIEILLLHTLLTALGYVVVVIIANTVAEVKIDLPLFFILSLTIFFTAIGCEWFYQGIEDFKYITIRGLIVKTISVLLLFLFVRTQDDLYWYAGYTVIGVLGGNVFNFFRLRKYITLCKLNVRQLHPMRHFLPALHVFALNLVISIYVQLNSIMLGFMAGDTAVGLFTAASKLSHMFLGISSALGTAMLPRMSYLIANGEKDKFEQMYRKSMCFMVGISLPITLGLIFTAPILIKLFAGSTYHDAIFTLQLLSPIVLAISMSGVSGIQVLYPMGKVSVVILATGIGAALNFLLNLWLIPVYAQDGAAVSTTIAEIAVTVSMLFIGRKCVSFRFYNKSYIYYAVASIVMAIGLFSVRILFVDEVLSLIVMLFTGTFFYGGSLLLVKEELIIEITNSIKARLISLSK